VIDKSKKTATIILEHRKETDVMKQPNIVLILMDDMGWRDLQCFGSDFYETPNIDVLAAQGALLSRAYAAYLVYSPGRTSLMTGKDPACIPRPNPEYQP